MARLVPGELGATPHDLVGNHRTTKAMRGVFMRIDTRCLQMQFETLINAAERNLVAAFRVEERMRRMRFWCVLRAKINQIPFNYSDVVDMGQQHLALPGAASFARFSSCDIDLGVLPHFRNVS